jgi:hypothetical protein
MENDIKLDKLCQEFVSLDAREKDYIIGISQALAFSLQQQSLSSGVQDISLQTQGGEPHLVKKTGG